MLQVFSIILINNILYYGVNCVTSKDFFMIIDMILIFKTETSSEICSCIFVVIFQILSEDV